MIRGKGAPKKAEAARPLQLLRVRRERATRCYAANNLHEITPSHCRSPSKTTLFGIQLPSSKQKIASNETGLNAQCALQKSRTAHVSEGSILSKKGFSGVCRQH